MHIADEALVEQSLHLQIKAESESSRAPQLASRLFQTAVAFCLTKVAAECLLAYDGDPTIGCQPYQGQVGRRGCRYIDQIRLRLI